jgi:C_GCAxxG_C_C family probable redox protein
LQEVFDMRDDNVFKAASGLGGGVGMMGDTCGALLGASMILSLKYGRDREDIGNFEKLKSSGVPVGKLYKWFEKEFGSATCHDIRTRFGGGAFYDFSIPWQRELADEAQIFDKCSVLVGKTAAHVTEMLWERDEEEKQPK